jgi:hypothetical protein
LNTFCQAGQHLVDHLAALTVCLLEAGQHSDRRAL